MILRAALFAPLVPRALRLEAARQVGRTADLEVLREMATRLPEGVPYALRLWPEQKWTELFLQPGLQPFLEPLLDSQAWRSALAYAGLEPGPAGEWLDRFPPEDPAARALLLVLACRWDDYLELDLGHTLLRQALELARVPVRLRALRLLPSSGRPELVRAAALPGEEWLTVPEEEWLPRLETLAAHAGEQLLALLPRLRPEQALCGLEMLARAGWTPPPAYQAAWNRLQEARLPPWRELAAMLAAPRVVGRAPVREGLALSPCGTRMAWMGSLARLDLEFEAASALPPLKAMRFAPEGEVLAGLHAGATRMFTVTHPAAPRLLHESGQEDRFDLSRTRHVTCGTSRLRVWPGPEEIAIPADVTHFAALDPPGAVVVTARGTLGLFWTRGQEMRWEARPHPGRVERLAVRPGRRRYVATSGPGGTVLWRVIELVSSPSLVRVALLPAGKQVSFWGDFLVLDGRLYQAETGKLVRELAEATTLQADLGDCLALGLPDRSLRLFRAGQERVVARLGPVEQIVRAPDGFWIVAGGELLRLQERERTLALGESEPDLPELEELLRFARAFEVQFAEAGEGGAGLFDIEL